MGLEWSAFDKTITVNSKDRWISRSWFNPTHKNLTTKERPAELSIIHVSSILAWRLLLQGDMG